MSLSFITDAMRQQASAEEKNKAMKKLFAEEIAANLVGQMAQSNVQRGTRRRGMTAASMGRQAEGMQQIELGKTRLELQKDIAEQQQLGDWIATASNALASFAAYEAKMYDDYIRRIEEATAVKESQAAEEAAMLTDYRKPGEEYSPSMLRVPDDPLVEELIKDEFDPQTTDGYFPRGGQVPEGYRGTGMTATEFKAARDAYRAEKATESLLDELVEDEAQDSAPLNMKKLIDKHQRGQVRESLSPGYRPQSEMTDDELAMYLFGGGET